MTSIVPVYVPAAISATLGETKAEAGVVPVRGITWIHETLLVANHDTPLEPELTMVSDCIGGFDPPSTATKLSPPGVTVSAEAALVEDATPKNAIVSARQSANLCEDKARDLMLNSSRCRTGVSLPASLYVGAADRSRSFPLGTCGKVGS